MEMQLGICVKINKHFNWILILEMDEPFTFKLKYFEKDDFNANEFLDEYSKFVSLEQLLKELNEFLNVLKEETILLIENSEQLMNIQNINLIKYEKMNSISFDRIEIEKNKKKEILKKIQEEIDKRNIHLLEYDLRFKKIKEYNNKELELEFINELKQKKDLSSLKKYGFDFQDWFKIEYIDPFLSKYFSLNLNFLFENMKKEILKQDIELYWKYIQDYLSKEKSFFEYRNLLTFIKNFKDSKVFISNLKNYYQINNFEFINKFNLKIYFNLYKQTILLSNDFNYKLIFSQLFEIYFINELSIEFYSFFFSLLKKFNSSFKKESTLQLNLVQLNNSSEMKEFIYYLLSFDSYLLELSNLILNKNISVWVVESWIQENTTHFSDMRSILLNLPFISQPPNESSHILKNLFLNLIPKVKKEIINQICSLYEKMINEVITSFEKTQSRSKKVLNKKNIDIQIGLDIKEIQNQIQCNQLGIESIDSFENLKKYLY